MKLIAVLHILSALALIFPTVCFSQLTIEIEGSYSGKNVYIQNPESVDSAGVFCVTSVTINGQAFPDSLTHDYAFEIPLSEMGLKEGEAVHIVIRHHDDCRPKVIHTAGCYVTKRAGNKTEPPKSGP